MRLGSLSGVLKPSKLKVGSGKTVTCTPDHKIYVVGKGWIEAQDLHIGDKLVHLSRSRRGAAYSGIKLSTEGQRAHRMEHRMVAKACYGEIPDDYDVHHIDGNTYNNDVDNLEVMPHGAHATLTRYECANDHMVCGYNKEGKWRFLPKEEKVGKVIIPIPEHLKSNMKNQSSARVVSIKEGPVTDVYDLHVKDTHNFIANCIVVHNCGEQPLPPYGACLLGSLNLVKYIKDSYEGGPVIQWFDYSQLEEDIPHIIRAMDNVVDRAIYPLPQQEWEAKNKRRMGIGVTALANTIEVLGCPYGSQEAKELIEKIMTIIRDGAYNSSVDLAIEKGPFPLFDKEKYGGTFFKSLPEDIQARVKEHGIRNSHLLSIAPTGTISLSADNVSSGCEPVFSHEYDRIIQTMDGPITEKVQDYAYRVFSVKGRTADECTVFDHVETLNLVSKYVDSACSKTCNVGADVSWEEFKSVYMLAYDGGASGCTTFRASGKRYGILTASAAEELVPEPTEEPDTFVDEHEGGACYYDPTTGLRQCE